MNERPLHERIWRLTVGLVGAILALLAAWAIFGDPVRPLDRPVGTLPALTLDGFPLDEDYFEGRPWVINVWLPG